MKEPLAISDTWNSQKWVWLTGLICLASYLYLGVHSGAYAQAQLDDLLWTSAICGAASFTLWRYYQRAGRQIPVSLLLGFALLFRLIGVFAFPVLEDDFYRYLWDGRTWVEHGTPYGIAPADFFDDEDLDQIFEQILGAINYPQIATIYGPVCQWLFALSYWVAPGQIWPLQVLFTGADMALIFLLLRLTCTNNVMLYAWSPLIIKEFAFTAHPDVLGAMLLFAAIVASQYRRWFSVALLLALATGVKVFALIAAPFLLRRRWQSWLVFTTSVFLISIPFGFRAAWFPEGLSQMATDWYFNAPLYLVLQPWLSPPWAKGVLLGGFVLFWLILFRDWLQKKTKEWKGALQPFRGDWLYGAFFLALPVLNPWYLVWLLPFAVIYPSRWAWTASLSLLLSYASGINLSGNSLGLYQHHPVLLAAEFGLISVALLYDFYSKRRKIN